MIRLLQYVFIAIIVTTVGFSLYQWNASRASTQKTAPNNGLVGYWSFNEGTGTQAGDASGNNNTGTLTGGPTWVSGKLGQAINFDGVDDHVITNLTTHYSQTTFSAWIYPRTLGEGNLGRIFDKRENGGTETFFLSMSTGTNKLLLQRVFSVTNGLWNSPNSSIVLNAWNHIVITYDETSTANDPVIYINGVSVTVSRVGGPSGTVLTNTDKYIIGNRGDTTRSFDGLIDEVRIYNRALSGTEVTNLYNLGAEKLNVSPVSNLTSGLVGYWTFDGKDTPWSSSSAGTATDRSGNSNTSTLTNMSQSTSVTRGQLGQALNFDGVDDYVSLPTTADFGLTNDFTLSSWFNNTNTSADTDIIFGKDTGASNWINFGLNSSHQVGLYCSTAGVSQYNEFSTATFNDSSWHHLIAVRSSSGTSITIYVDGISIKTSTGLSPCTFSKNGYVNIGTYNAGVAHHFKGSLDEVRIYNRALSAGEVQSLYDLGASDKVNSSVSQNQGTGRLDSGLVGYWKLDDASGTTATDSSTNANNGTLTNGPTWGTGQIGGDVVFDGVDDYVNIPSISSINFDYNIDFSFSTWVKIPSTQNDLVAVDNSILEKWGSAGAYPYVLRLYNQSYGTVGDRGKVFFARYDATNNPSVKSVTLLNDNLWHLVNGTKSGATLSLYVDGVLQSTSTDTTTTTTTNVSPLYIGVRAGTANRFQGSIDEVRIYNRALSADEVSQLYRLTAPTGVDTSLKGYWSFDGSATNWTSSSAGTTSDLSGSGNTGTLTNMSQSTSVMRGKLGQALNFDGVDDSVNMGNVLNIGTADVTFAAWIKPPNVNQMGSIISKRHNTGSLQQYGMYVGSVSSGGGFVSSKKIGYFFYDGVALNVTHAQSAHTTNDIVDGNWHHVVVARENGSLPRIYVDGVNQSLAIDINGTTNVNTDTTDPLRIGESYSGQAIYGGSIDDVRVYNRALNSTEISSLYNSGR